MKIRAENKNQKDQRRVFVMETVIPNCPEDMLCGTNYSLIKIADKKSDKGVSPRKVMINTILTHAQLHLV